MLRKILKKYPKYDFISKYNVNFAPILKHLKMSDKLNRLRVVMAEKEKTGIWLGKKIGKSNTTVSKYMNQKVQPDLRTLYNIANALDVDVKDLLISNKR